MTFWACLFLLKFIKNTQIIADMVWIFLCFSIKIKRGHEKNR